MPTAPLPPDLLAAALRPHSAPPWPAPLCPSTGQRNLATHPALDGLAPWYHDLDSLGLRVTQRPGIFPINQLCKEPGILGYLHTAITKARSAAAQRPSVLELFCADGYYSAHARRAGALAVTGIDLDEAAVQQANTLFQVLFGISNAFVVADVYAFRPPEPVDILLNCGGLYHLADPVALLTDCRPRFSARFMIVQSVVTLESESPDYFVQPAPGWTWGCRFSFAFLQRAIQRTGWRIVDCHRNALEGNERPCDRGSAYFFCQWP